MNAATFGSCSEVRLVQRTGVTEDVKRWGASEHGLRERLVHPDAESELGNAAVYYATHASAMIALAFLAEYERVRDLLIENQQLGPVQLPLQSVRGLPS